MSETTITTQDTPAPEPTTTQEPEKPTTAPQEPGEGFIAKDKYDAVLQESMARKNTINELKAQLDAFNNLAGEGATPEEKFTSLTSQLDTMKAQMKKMEQLNAVRDVITKLDPLDARVAELAFKDASDKGVVDSPELLGSYLEQWKQDNPALFAKKAEEKQITQPLPSQQPAVATPPVEMTPEEEYEAYKKLSPEERRKLGPRKAEEMSKLAGRIVADKLNG